MISLITFTCLSDCWLWRFRLKICLVRNYLRSMRWAEKTGPCKAVQSKTPCEIQFDKYGLEIHLRNTVEENIWEIKSSCIVQDCWKEMHSKIQSRNAVKPNKIFIYQRSTLAILACPWELDLFICSSQIFYQSPIESSSDIKASRILTVSIENLYWLFINSPWMDYS